MLPAFFCCFRGVRGISGDGISPPSTSPPPTYTEACTEGDSSPVDGWSGGKTVKDGPTTKSKWTKGAPQVEMLAPLCAGQSQKGLENVKQPSIGLEHDRTAATLDDLNEAHESQFETPGTLSMTERFKAEKTSKSKTPSDTIDWIRSFNFDNHRISALQTVESRLGPFTAREAIDLVRSFNFDNNRIRGLQIVESRLGPFTAREAIDLVRSFDFDNGRIRALRMVETKLCQFTARTVEDLVRSFDFDNDRIRALQMVESK